jgi:hypothetical protein
MQQLLPALDNADQKYKIKRAHLMPQGCEAAPVPQSAHARTGLRGRVGLRAVQVRSPTAWGLKPAP